MEEKHTPAFESGSVTSALSRVRNTLNFSLKTQYGIEDKEVTNKFLRMHGLDSARFDFLNNFESLIESGISDASIDTNANKSDVSITGFFSETAMPINKLVGYRYLYRKLKDMYGKKRAKYLTGKMYDMSLAIADSTNILKPYCFSVNAQKLVFEGRPFGALHSLPPRRIGSYIHSLTEILHQLSNHTAGALAVGSFFLDIAYIMFYREHRALCDIYNDKAFAKMIENEMQSFIHSMNHLSRNAVESPFTNISVFDRAKLEALLDDDNLGWYFDKESAVDGVPTRALEDCGDRDWIQYVIETILKLEDIFMGIMDRGDVAHDGRPITFPVTTINFSRYEDENGNYHFVDPDYVDYICKNHDITRFNIYISDGMKVASCCFTYDTDFNFYDENGNPCNMSLGDYVETRIPNCPKKTSYDISLPLPGNEKVRGMNGTIVPITAVHKLHNQWKQLVRLTFEGGDQLWATPNQVFVLRNGEHIEARDITPDTWLYKEALVTAVDTFDSDDYVYDIEVGCDDHFFKLKLPKCGKNVSVSNCRLINDNDLFELGGQVNSFGGTALSLGSHRVVTINMRRVALECDSFENYKEILNTRMEEAADILIAHRELLKDMVAKGTQPFIDNGWLDLNRMFSTFGIMGYYEAAEDLTRRFGGDIDYLAEIISEVDKLSRKLSAERKNVFNVEEIPGENMAAKLADTDRWIFGEEKVPEKLYANQFVPLWKDATLYEKFHREGKLSAQLTGGGIVHFSLGEKLTSAQTRNVVTMALEEGVEHFALNPTYSICKNDHYTFGKHETCPTCGEPIIDNLTRTVGFFVRTSNMTTPKREYDFKKRHYKGV